MAVAGPVGNDNLDISFRLHSKTQVFDGSNNALTNAKLNIVTSACSYGLVFVGSTKAEIFVICTKDLETPTALNQNAPVRRIPVPSQVTQMATNCDGTILAVDVKINGIPHIQLYSVPSFLSPNVQKIRELRISADNSSSIQLCWNPVLNLVLAVCTESGGLNLYSFKDQGVDFHAIDPSLKAKCCCWSPKGKQIVAGFANGKLMQFNMELKTARTIDCPQGIFQASSFDVIAVQWLSTYQFAAAFLSHQDGSRPILHIINAPKAGPPQYIAYNDICYSTSEVRPSKIYLQYIQSWGMLLVASANCVDVSFLRISRPGDIPEWTQEFPNDQYLAELPLTPEKDESFPVGFEIDTACSNKLKNEDGNPYSVMPLIHIVSTYGVMCSFYVLNTTNTYVDICSPPRPIDLRAQSLFAVNEVVTASSGTASQVKSPPVENVDFKTPLKNDTPAPISHSTPSVPKNNLFGAPTSSTLFSAPLQNQSMTFTGFSIPAAQNKPLTQPQPISTGFQMPKPIATVTSQPSPIVPPQNQPLLSTPQSQQPTQPNQAPLLSIPQAPQVSQNQPLITVPPTYNPQPVQQKSEAVKESSVNEKLSEAEDEQIYLKMIQDEIKAFELELNFLMDKSRALKVNIGTKEESAEMRRKLEELDELKKEATETIESLRSDVQTNRLGLTEMFSMVYEAKAKCNQANNGKSIIMSQNQIQDRSIKRTLDKLKRMISQCEMQIQIVVQLLNSQWANYQDTLTKNKKNKMHIPSLEGVYQTLTKQQEIIYNLSAKLKLLKSKLGIFDDVKKQKNANINATIESLSDSIISISLIDQVQNEKSKLTTKKHKNLLNYLENREVVNIKPQRPKLPGLNSEIIIEKKIKAMKSLKKPEQAKKPTAVLKPKEPSKPTPTTTTQNVPKNQPETVFGSASQKTSIFSPSPVPTSSASQIQPSFAKKPDEQPKSTGFSFANFGSSSSQASFATSLGFSSNSLVANTEKKKEDLTPKTQQTAPPKNSQEVKPVSTISNANISVSANFSVSLPSSKPSPPQQVPKEPSSKVEEKKSEAVKPLTSNETTSFTFSLPAKSKESVPTTTKSNTAAITFGSSPSTASDTVKSAFGSATNAFSFGSKVPEFKSATSPSAGSIFGTSSNVSFGVSDVGKSASSNIFASASQVPKTTAEESKTTTTTTTPVTTSSIFGTNTTSAIKSSFSFASLGTTIPTTVSSSDSIFTAKKETTPTSVASPPNVLSNTPQSSSPDSSLQGLNICSPSEVPTTTSPSNIFATPVQSPKTAADSLSIFGSSSTPSSFGTQAQTSLASKVIDSSTKAVTTSTQSSSIFGQATSTASSFGGLDLSSKSSSTTTNVFGTASLVKPDQSVFGQTAQTSTPPATSTFSNIFADANNTTKPASTTSSIFGTSSASPATTTPSNIFGSSSTPSIFGQSGQSSIFGQTPTTTSGGSIFGQAAQSSSVFGQSPSTGSIFGQTATTTASSTGSIFSQGSFSSPSNAASGSIFSGQSNTQSPFAAAAPASSTNIFGQSSVFGGNSATSNVFGSSSSTPNVFGSSAATSSTSPFGSTNIFTQNQNQPAFGGNPTFSNTFGGSTFGSGGSIFAQQQSQPVFGASPTFGSPKSNIFGSSSVTSTSPQASAPTNNIFEQLGSQQSGNLFGSLAQATQQPAPQQQGGFSGSAFSSWR